MNESPSPPFRSFAAIAVSMIALVITVGVVLTPAPRAAGQVAVHADAPSGEKPLREMTDAELRERLIGQWRLLEHGEQIIDSRADGTATIAIKFNFLVSLIFGPRMDMNLKWHVKDSILTHIIESGTPQSSVDELIRRYGDKKSYHILEFTADRLWLEEVDPPHDRYDWRPWIGREFGG